MKLSASNIGWDKSEDEKVYGILKKYGFEGVDAIPSRMDIGESGLRAAGMQSLLFGHPELTIFEDKDSGERTFEFLSEILRQAGRAGISAAVFGSPANRRIGEITEEKLKIAHKFFSELGRVAEEAGTVLCLEPNPIEYGADFLTRTEEAFKFVKDIDVKGLRLNLDASTMIINGEDPTELIEKYAEFIGHVHMSAPHLEPLKENSIYGKMMFALKHAGYKGWVALEMKRPVENSLDLFEESVRYLKELNDKLSRKVVMVLPKGPVPYKGRYGKLEWQDWYKTCVRGVNMVKSDPNAVLVVVTGFSTPKDGDELECYRKALLSLGIDKEKLIMVGRGQETVEQLHIADEYAKAAGADLIILHTLTHSLRVRYLCWKDNIKAKAINTWSGLPRPREAVTDIILAFVFPLLDFFGYRDNFRNWVLRRRATGKL